MIKLLTLPVPQSVAGLSGLSMATVDYETIICCTTTFVKWFC